MTTTPKTEKATTEKVILHLPSLVACLPFASKDDTRAYLTGVYVHYKDGQTVYAATDGHRLCLAKPSPDHAKRAEGIYEGPTTKGHQGFIIAPEDVKEIVRWWAKRSSIAAANTACVEICGTNGGKLKFRSWDGRMALKSRPIDATYPDYERVLPAKDKPLAPAEEVGFNLAYLSGLKEVARIFSHPKTLSAKCRFYGNSAPVAFDMENPDQDKATVVIMPMRV